MYGIVLYPKQNLCELLFRHCTVFTIV